MAACGIDLDAEAQLHEVDFYTSHEALLLGVRGSAHPAATASPATGTTARRTCSGSATAPTSSTARTSSSSRVQNPIGVEGRPRDRRRHDSVVELCRRLDPAANPAGSRSSPHGRRHVVGSPAVACSRACAVHGNRGPVGPVRPDARQHVRARERLQDPPLRRGDARGRAVLRVAAASRGVWPGGVHVELTGDDVTECLGGGDEATAAKTSRPLRDPCATHGCNAGGQMRCDLAHSVRAGRRLDRRMSDGPAGIADLGPNAGLVDEMYRLFQENPQAVVARLARVLRRLRPARPGRRRPHPRRRPPRRRPRRAGTGARAAPAASDGRARSCSTARRPSRCAARRRASSRTWRRASRSRPPRRCASVPAKLLEVNRQILNNHLARARGGKVLVHAPHRLRGAPRARARCRDMNSSFGVVDGKPSVVRHEHVNLGLAIDLQKSDGTRTLLVPNIKDADTLDFAAFHAAYEELIRKARTNKLDARRLRRHDGLDHEPGHDRHDALGAAPHARPGRDRRRRRDHLPARVRGRRPADARRASASARSSRSRAPTTTASSRARRAASSSPRCTTCCSASDDFYDEIFASFGVPYEPARWSRDHKPLDGLGRGAARRSSRCSSSSTCTACAAT